MRVPRPLQTSFIIAATAFLAACDRTTSAAVTKDAAPQAIVVATTLRTLLDARPKRRARRLSLWIAAAGALAVQVDAALWGFNWHDQSSIE